MKDSHTNALRARLTAMAADALARGKPTGWFEPLYQSAKGDLAFIPWADRGPNPHLVEWVTRKHIHGDGRRALVVGCGLGDDAEWLAGQGFTVTGFDIAPTAITWCRQRFPSSTVSYQVADLLQPPREWLEAFDFVFEAYTLQALPPDVRRIAMEPLGWLVVRRGGQLLVVCRGRNIVDPLPEAPPWPLAHEEFQGLAKMGLAVVEREDFMESGDPPIRRFRILYQTSR